MLDDKHDFVHTTYTLNYTRVFQKILKIMELYCIKCLYLIILIAQFGVTEQTFGKLFVSRIKGTNSIHVNSKLLSVNDRIAIRVREVLSIHVIYHRSSSVSGVGNRRV